MVQFQPCPALVPIWKWWDSPDYKILTHRKSPSPRALAPGCSCPTLCPGSFNCACCFFNPNSSKPECLHPFRSHSCRGICPWPLFSYSQRSPPTCLSASHSELSMWKMYGKGTTGGACANLTHHTLWSHRWKSARRDQVASGTFQAVGAFQSLWVRLLPNSRRQVWFY